MPIFIKTEIIKKEYLIQKDIRKKVINEHIQWIGNLKRKGINIKSGFLVNELNFMQVVSSPLTRSSYHTEEIQKLMKKFPR